VSRVLRWFRNALIGLVALVAATSLVIYVVSERVLRRHYPATPTDLFAFREASSVAEGLRLAQFGRRFSHFTDDEIAELHGYLVARAGK